MPSDKHIRAAATQLYNDRAGRKGLLHIPNILDVLPQAEGQELLNEARAILQAAEEEAIDEAEEALFKAPVVGTGPIYMSKRVRKALEKTSRPAKQVNIREECARGIQD